MNPKILFINIKRPRLVVNNITHRQGRVFEAHTEASSGHPKYVSEIELQVVKKMIQENKTELAVEYIDSL